jgi:PERQ amino acid-rich with GYF domain-containing protein
MKWLANALSGLNSDANVEQIMQILLDFPVDADAEVVEIMAELVYQNSKTMDGRRFAADFTSKRKADLKNGGARASGAGASGTKGAVVSIADVVKAQPKPTPQDGWSFKVVNKKKKGGRS